MCAEIVWGEGDVKLQGKMWCSPAIRELEEEQQVCRLIIALWAPRANGREKRRSSLAGGYPRLQDLLILSCSCMHPPVLSILQNIMSRCSPIYQSDRLANLNVKIWTKIARRSPLSFKGIVHLVFYISFSIFFWGLWCIFYGPIRFYVKSTL